jgi:hypothetical protein
MDNNTEKINELLVRLENLQLQQQGFEAEINALRHEVIKLQFGNAPVAPPAVKPVPMPQVVIPPKNTPASAYPSNSFANKFNRKAIEKSDFEKFIGENLISKIGILILIIGVGIGAKLAIDKGLISPLTRIILAYAVGVGLMGFAMKLKAKYEQFSAVLLSGAIAILYFVTFAAHVYYQLIPQVLAFVMMVIFTGFTVIAAITYNRQVIANIGLVGAYAVPFLLSNGSGNVVVLLAYIAIINFGILVLAFKKYWKSLFYLSFGLTWIIFLAWRIPLDDQISFLKTSMLFSGIYFIAFYITNLAYKVIRKEVFEISDVIVLLLNSFIFYGAGYWVLSQSALAKDMLGLFTLGNAILHFVVGWVIYKRKLTDNNLFYFILALVITFITMAVPVQLSGSWVTIFWATEAAILYFFGKERKIVIYEKLAFPLVFLAFFSLVEDWLAKDNFFGYYAIEAFEKVVPFFNINFLSALIVIAAFSWMLIVSNKQHVLAENSVAKGWSKLLAYAIAGILIIVTYVTFAREITHIFENEYQKARINVSPRNKSAYFTYNENYQYFNAVCQYMYALLFASMLTLLNLRKFKSRTLAVTNLTINLVVILGFLTHGLFVLSELRAAYIEQSNNYFTNGTMNIGIRYVAYAFFAILIICCYQLSKSTLFKVKFKTAFDYLLYLAVLWLLSSELLHLLELNGLRTGYKLGLSILWGVYALLLIGIGIAKNKKYVRIGAIALFAITLIKVVLYDLSALDTISKTIVFVSLGVLLLIISFLYNKYKHLIADDVKTEL